MFIFIIWCIDREGKSGQFLLFDCLKDSVLDKHVFGHVVHLLSTHNYRFFLACLAYFCALLYYNTLVYKTLCCVSAVAWLQLFIAATLGLGLSSCSSPIILKITRAQNPNGAANKRHRQHQQQVKREKELARLGALQQSSSSQLVVSHRQVVLRHNPSSPPAPNPGLVSSSFGPLVNLVPTTDEEVRLSALNSSRLVQTQQEEQAHPAPAPLQTQPECPSLDAADVDDQQPVEGSVVVTSQSTPPADTEHVLQVTLDDTEVTLQPQSPVQGRLASVVTVPETSTSAKRKASSSSHSSRRHGSKRPRREGGRR